ncbi:hypothetical protein IQ255_19130 [Pleurocapsales cyanobacterium LEGE 10410]|nr:hypothetical protein [Pleurocapsales cyanobacterium LEGE 10410]
MSQINNNSHSSNDIQEALFADCLANSKEIFQLIDSMFPVDSCRHYQVLPLKLEANDLTLGMLQPNEEESLKFVNSIARVFQYNLEIKSIDSQTIEIILASYANTQQPQEFELDRNKTVIDTNFNPSKNHTPSRKSKDSAPTVVSQSAQNTPPELPELPDLPPDLDFFKDMDLASQSAKKSPPSKTDSAATLYEIPPEFVKQQKSDGDDKLTIVAEDPANSEVAFSEGKIAEVIAETKQPIKTATETPQDKDFLPRLSAKLSWGKLLDQAIKYQSEQLDLIRDRTQVIAYQNGSLQSCIEQVPLPIFCSLIDEIKKMARLPLNTTAHPKKMVIEKLHNQERILLRIELMFQEQETVKIQILRDRAIQVYEQQQMDKTSEQALQLARNLERTLKKIQTCFQSAHLSNLAELQAVQSRINHRLRALDK